MRKLFMICILAACPGLARAAETATCDAKPFTLNKPKSVGVQKPERPSTANAAPAEPATPKATAKAKTNHARSKPIADCHEPSRKKD